MATGWLACVAEADKWIVSCVKWLDCVVVDSELTRFHMAAESVWMFKQGFSGTGHVFCFVLFFFKAFFSVLFFFLERKLLTPHPDGHGRTTGAFVCTFLFPFVMISRPENMLRSLISNLAKPTSHTCMAFITHPPCVHSPFWDTHSPRSDEAR